MIHTKLNEYLNSQILKKLNEFGIDDIDENGYVTLYHGDKKLPKILNKDQIFFLTSDYNVAVEYAKKHNGKVFTLKVKPEDVRWNTGSYEIEFDKGGIIKNGIIIPFDNKKRIPKSYEEIKKSFNDIDDGLLLWVERTVRHYFYIEKLRFETVLQRLKEDIEYFIDLKITDKKFIEFVEINDGKDKNKIKNDLNKLYDISIDDISK